MLHLVQRLVLASTQHVYCVNEVVVTPTTRLFILLLLLLPHKKNFYMPNYGNLYAFWAKKKTKNFTCIHLHFSTGMKNYTWSNKFVICRKSAWQVTQNTLLKFTYIINSVKSWEISITRLNLSVKYRNDCFLTSGRFFKNQQNVYIITWLMWEKGTTLTQRTIHRQIEVSKSSYFLHSRN